LKARLKVQVWVYAADSRGELAFLVLKLTTERGGFWQPVTGTVEPGEALADAADRESDEETGLRFLGPSEAVGSEFEFENQGKRFHETVFCRRAEWTTRGKFRLDANEHVQGEWVTAQEASARMKYDSNREGLERTLARVRS
jgi:8-oxo-dGTP pyrophosphatase MutT (NUDIX family)